MTTTACDDQVAPDPSSREAAIEAMVMEVQPHEWRQGGAMRYQGHLITWGEYVQAAEKGRKFDHGKPRAALSAYREAEEK